MNPCSLSSGLSALKGLSRRLIWLYFMCLFLSFPAVARPQAEKKREIPVDSLIYDLKNPDPVRRKDAAVLLGKNKVHRAIPDLIAAVNDSDPSVRREIILALDNMRDVKSI